MILCSVPFYAAALDVVPDMASQTEEIVEADKSLGRAIPAYFKIMTFEKAHWERFADAFSGHPIAEDIKKDIESIQLAPLVFSREEIFASKFFKIQMRNTYNASFRGEKPFAPNIDTVNSDGMYAAILNLLGADESAVARFEVCIDREMALYQKIITAYNHRLAVKKGNSALLRHFLSKIFFAPDAYTNPLLINMRLTLLTEGLVAGDDYLFAEQKDLSHTLAESISKYIKLEGPSDTLVIGCGHSLIADVADTPNHFADEFLNAYTGKTFVHDCQHCLCNHDRQIAVAITEPGLAADVTYNGAAHADIFASATTPEFWNTLAILKNEGKSPIKCIIDHAYMLGDRLEQIANSLNIGGIFRTYLDLAENPLELHGFELRGIEMFGERIERIYVKVR